MRTVEKSLDILQMLSRACSALRIGHICIVVIHSRMAIKRFTLCCRVIDCNGFIDRGTYLYSLPGIKLNSKLCKIILFRLIHTFYWQERLIKIRTNTKVYIGTTLKYRTIVFLILPPPPSDITVFYNLFLI